MFRRRLVPLTVVTVLLVCAVPATGAAKTGTRSELWPGVTYERTVQFTTHGPVVLSVLTGPRPNGGPTTLAPILSSETLTGRETVSAMQRRVSPVATVAGVNGDFSSFDDGTPSGVLLRNGQLEHPPIGGRSSLGIAADGTLDVRRVEFFATWLGTGRRRVLNDLNDIPASNQVSLFTTAWGAATPSVPGAVSAVLVPFPAAVPNSDLVAPVVEVRREPSVPIPIGGAVLVARGSAAAALEAEALVGGNVTIKLILRPDWLGVANAIGGGPQIVRNGAPIFRAGEAFLTTQLGPRAPRTAAGQRADGRVLLVAVDGRRPGYSVGMTNFELAQAMVRLGCVTAMALDGGGSTTMAFEGTVLNLPSDGAERPIGNALAFHYTGAYLAEAPAVVSPDGDGVDDAARLRVKLVRPSATVVRLTAPDGTLAFTETHNRSPGMYPIAFPSVVAAGPPVREGKWTLTAEATDDVGRATSMSRTFRVDTTLGFLRARTPVYVPPRGRDHRIIFRLTRPARVLLTVATPDGTVVRTLARRRYEPGRIELTWNGLGRDRKPSKGGRYVVHAVATSTLGTVEQRRTIRVQRVAGPKPTVR